jgi:hypothetical protein
MLLRMMMRGVMALVLLLGVACGGAQVRPGGVESPLSLERVVLYRNGVAYFERRGVVRGDRLTLRVRKDQINDLLKSLAVVDRGSGQVVSVSIPLDPSSWQKAALSALRPGHGQLAEVLDSLRGTAIEVDAGRRSVSGRIVMVERVQVNRPEPREALEEDYRLTLIDGADLAVVRLSEVRGFTLLDGEVALQIDRHLDASAGEGMFQQVELTLRLSGEGEHDLAVSYVAPAPQWKPTYRIVIDDEHPGQALLQAWAVVDNVSGENWQAVRLSLTAGEPLAFRYDLHSPREVERPDLSHSAADKRARVAIGERTAGDEALTVEAEPAAPSRAMPEAEEEYVADDAVEAKARSRRLGTMGSGAAVRSLAPGRVPAPAPAVSAQAMARSTAARGSTERISGLTRFDLRDRVTLPDGSASMVALINQRVKGEQVFLYRPGGSGQGYELNPYRVVRFHNDTDFALEPGPISIFAGGSFVGEGLSEAVGSRDTATIPFAVEPSLVVRSKVERSGEKMRVIKLSRGVLEVESYARVSTEWTVQGDGREAYRVLVRHPREGGRHELVDPPPGVEELKDAYLVPVQLPAGQKQAQVTVVEQTPVRTSVSIWDGRAVELFDLWLASDELDAKMRAKLEPIAEKRREIGRIDSEIRSLEKQKAELNERARETRLSLRAIEKDKAAGALRRKLGQRLDEFTREADAVGRRIVELSSRRLELKIELEDLLESL